MNAVNQVRGIQNDTEVGLVLPRPLVCPTAQKPLHFGAAEVTERHSKMAVLAAIAEMEIGEVVAAISEQLNMPLMESDEGILSALRARRAQLTAEAIPRLTAVRAPAVDYMPQVIGGWSGAAAVVDSLKRPHSFAQSPSDFVTPKKVKRPLSGPFRFQPAPSSGGVIQPVPPADSNNSRMPASKRKLRSKRPRVVRRKGKKGKLPRKKRVRKSKSFVSRVLSIINPPLKHYSLKVENIANSTQGQRAWAPQNAAQTDLMCVGTQEDLVNLEAIANINTSNHLLVKSARMIMTFHNPTNAVMTVTIFKYGFKRDLKTADAKFNFYDDMVAGLALIDDTTLVPSTLNIGFNKPWQIPLMSQIYSCKRKTGITFTLHPGEAKSTSVSCTKNFNWYHEFDAYANDTETYTHYAGYTRGIAVTIVGDFVSTADASPAALDTSLSKTHIQIAVKKEFVFTVSDDKGRVIGGVETLDPVTTPVIRRHDGPQEAFDFS